jgi:predicted nucleotidyltransferase
MILKKIIGNIKKTLILKFVPAKRIYLFGSYAYGKPTEKSDIDIYIVTLDDITDFSELYTRIVVDLSYKNIFFIDLHWVRRKVSIRVG